MRIFALVGLLLGSVVACRDEIPSPVPSTAVPQMAPTSTGKEVIPLPLPPSIDIAVEEALKTLPFGNWTLPIPNLYNPETYYLQLVKDEREKLAEGFADNKGIPEIDSLSKMFSKHIVVGYISRETGEHIFPDTMGLRSSILKILLYPRILRESGQINSLILYAHDMSALLIPALKSDSKVWEHARVFHEMYHAMQEKLGRPGSVSKSYTPEWVNEEVRAHILARKVLTRGTGGKYETTLKRLAKGKGNESCRQVVEKVTYHDLLALDSVTGPSTKDEELNRIFQSFFDICITALQNKYQGKDLEEKKVESYLVLSRKKMIVAPTG